MTGMVDWDRFPEEPFEGYNDSLWWTGVAPGAEPCSRGTVDTECHHIAQYNMRMRE